MSSASRVWPSSHPPSSGRSAKDSNQPNSAPRPCSTVSTCRWNGRSRSTHSASSRGEVLRSGAAVPNRNQQPVDLSGVLAFHRMWRCFAEEASSLSAGAKANRLRLARRGFPPKLQNPAPFLALRCAQNGKTPAFRAIFRPSPDCMLNPQTVWRMTQSTANPSLVKFLDKLPLYESK